MNLFAFFGLLAAATASAAPFPLDLNLAQSEGCNLFHETDFIPALKGIQETELPVKVLAASPVVVFPRRDKLEAHCSSSVVSDSGTILSAGHCIEDCMIASHAVSQFAGTPSKPLISIFDLTQRSDSSPIVCSARINGQNLKVEVVAARFCHVMDMKASGLSDEARKTCLAQPDFAVLRPLPTKAKKKVAPLPCLKLGNSEETDGRKVMVVGFPRDTHRKNMDPNALDSNGKDQFVSFGQVERQSNCRVDVKRELYNIRDLDALSDYIQLDADAVEGNSGGPVVLQDTGRIVGVVARSISDENRYCRGSAFGTSITQMRRALAPKIDHDAFDALFACDKNAAVPESGL